MIAKLLGCGLLLAAALAASLQRIRKERRRLALLEGWIAFLTLAKDEIEYRAAPLSALLEKTDPTFLELLGTEEKNLVGYLCASEAELDKDTVDCLSALCCAFGSAYRDDLILACEHALSLLQQKRQVLLEALPKQKRQTFSVAFLAAGLAILLLW